MISIRIPILLTACFTLLYLVNDPVYAQNKELKTELFVSGENGYGSYRIPAIITTKEGTLLAFCEGRKESGDAGDIDLLLRRSLDNGRTWSKTEVVWDDGKNTCGNPCPVVDESTGIIWLLMTHNIGEDKETNIIKRVINTLL